jgi:hypothetical protein
VAEIAVPTFWTTLPLLEGGVAVIPPAVVAR